ncbi:DegT/DnrJ/EryC1/StrS family aminotransferase [Pseudobutyrivibrio xylanivorans]|uniref:dTDP-4-amino-4,6-dideoxygalactose transaminase n=1 Tax=Pseudobutyrivibrio xylanivorans TaxID=185007 RepID=A0A1G5S478_PSEXY|nr:DegT/DnrJ/EryC1/StrS family aminotransferase [Pseudobutyrivibrio xylanivorans]SCZ81222.1 dTDP-4-amino-4,6-dideoxygalactose transaminase [Pseudobutyrivibrio xylanivorans]
MIPLVKPYIAPKEEMLPAIEKILYSGYIAEGEAVYKFENELSNYLNNPNLLVVNSGTAALHIALTLLGIGKGDEVISTPMTAEPTNTTIALTGAKVVWADIDEETGLLDPESVRMKISERTKAIMLVHYAGMVCDLDKFNAISEETGIPIIEDSAHCLGGKYNGNIIGSNSRFTCFSFQAIKQMTTVDGGAIALKDEKDMEKARKLRWFGLDKKVSRLENDIKQAGFKYGMNNVNATIGSVQLRHKEVIQRYIENGKYFDEALKGASGVTLIPYYNNTEPSYWLYTMKVGDRDDFCRMMESEGIMASPLHHRSDTHSVFSESKCSLEHMDKWYKSFVHIPCGWWVDDEVREKIVDCIKKGW